MFEGIINTVLIGITKGCPRHIIPYLRWIKPETSEVGKFSDETKKEM
jgi:hypothetical protein